MIMNYHVGDTDNSGLDTITEDDKVDLAELLGVQH